ncbi:MAG: nucleotidyltransferase domain-containing protein [Alphaproteobacteria bacterium]|nr:nucleotidyltransferase domain-containing protein [Alphaproteobacteria bacterium]MCW5743555.1 nucleotidyltransferase domain-containing protein [Alphaproteobacteria bacterium]
MTIQLEADHLEEVRRLLDAHLPGARAWCFGSRATGDARRFSDLDIAVEMEGGVPWRRLSELKEAFSDSDLPITVDVVDWDTLDPEFRAAVEKRRVPL